MAETTSEYINIKVVSQVGVQLCFKMKKTTQLKKLFEAYCSRVSIARSNVRFLFDGKRLTDRDTSTVLQLEDGDIIDVVGVQSGGGGSY